MHPNHFSFERSKQKIYYCTQAEFISFKELTVSLNFFGHGVILQAPFPARYLQQNILRLQAADVVTAKQVLGKLIFLKAFFTYFARDYIKDTCYLAFSEASTVKCAHGQTGLISGLNMPAGKWMYTMFWIGIVASSTESSSHPLGPKHPQPQLPQIEVHSWPKISITSFATKRSFHFLSVDSYGLYYTIITLYERTGYRLRPTVERLRDSSEKWEIYTM